MKMKMMMDVLQSYLFQSNFSCHDLSDQAQRHFTAGHSLNILACRHGSYYKVAYLRSIIIIIMQAWQLLQRCLTIYYHHLAADPLQDIAPISLSRRFSISSCQFMFICLMHVHVQGVFNILCPPPRWSSYFFFRTTLFNTVISKQLWHITWPK